LANSVMLTLLSMNMGSSSRLDFVIACHRSRRGRFVVAVFAAVPPD
jgi:hypothetical protein